MSTPTVPATFRALRMVKDDAGIRPEFQQLTLDDLGEGDTLVRVQCSSLNYKDGLAVMGRPGVLRRYPIIPGIDLAGEVISSESGEYQPGDDLRHAITRGREANLVLLAVDASGSMAARKRMGEVKTAVLSLLLDAYRAVSTS